MDTVLKQLKKQKKVKKISIIKMNKKLADGWKGVFFDEVQHDDWCRVLTHGGGMESCTCNPTHKYYIQIGK